MSCSDEWLRGLKRPKTEPKPAEPVPVESTTWKPWADMTAEERRKALSEREDATPEKARR